MTPEEFADEAKVHRSTVYRIENLDINNAPRIETISALVESRGKTVTQFFAELESVSATAPLEIGSRELEFLKLPLAAKEAGMGVAFAIALNQPPAVQHDESRHGRSQATDTKSGSGRRR